MENTATAIETQIKEFCSELGNEPLLVQGAGGNVSWKDECTLWIKASGMWLVDADSKEIFVPVNLEHLKASIAKKRFNITPLVNNTSALRPSIETLMHALLPHRIVVHLHSIEILSYLVRPNFREQLNTAIGNLIDFACVDYYKPGQELAQSIYEVLNYKPDIDVIFLKNHGVVIGGEDVGEIRNLLFEINRRLKSQPKFKINAATSAPVPVELENKYTPLKQADISLLATKPTLYSRLDTNWCLYPDHIVFLGPKANLYSSWKEFQDKVLIKYKYPDLVFIENQGVYVTSQFSISQQAQLKCYFDVLIRQDADGDLCSMCDADVNAILEWDAENYRILHSKH
jgi:rhamnose utilization protein RhaD (predicted bifunctional aldolase and dehydrogenase)